MVKLGLCGVLLFFLPLVGWGQITTLPASVDSVTNGNTSDAVIADGVFTMGDGGARKIKGSYFKVSGPTAARTFTFPDANATITQTIFSGTITLDTTSIASTACTTVVAGSTNSVAATGVLTTDTVIITPNASIKAQGGFTAATTGGLTVTAYPTSGYVNLDVCNWSSGAIVPGTVVVNVKVLR